MGAAYPETSGSSGLIARFRPKTAFTANFTSKLCQVLADLDDSSRQSLR